MTPKEVVMAYQKALGEVDYKTAKSYMSAEGFTFKGPLASHEKPEGLLKDLEMLHHIVEDVEMKKVFAEGDDVCLLYDLITKSPSVRSFTCDWYHVVDGKIRSIRVVFDARPFAEIFEKRKPE